jgi:hypothetical protein
MNHVDAGHQLEQFAVTWLEWLLDSGAELNEEALRKLSDKNEAVWAAIQKLDELQNSGKQTPTPLEKTTRG